MRHENMTSQHEGVHVMISLYHNSRTFIADLRSPGEENVG